MNVESFRCSFSTLSLALYLSIGLSSPVRINTNNSFQYRPVRQANSLWTHCELSEPKETFLGANHLTFDGWGEWGYEWFALGKNFFSKPLVISFFSLTYTGVRFFFQNYTPWKIFFFSVGIFMREMFFFEIGLQDIFFLKSPIRSYLHQKSNGQSLIRAPSWVPSPRQGGLRDESKERRGG